MQHGLGIVQIMLGISCAIIATLIVVHDVPDMFYWNMLAMMLAISGMVLAAIGLYLVSTK